MHYHRFMRICKDIFDVRYHCRRIFRPYNRLQLLNVGRGYCDADKQMFHAVFTCLHRWIYSEYSGYEKFCEYVDYANSDEHQYDDMWADNYFPRHQLECLNVSKELWDWYSSIDWSDPTPMPQQLLDWYSKRNLRTEVNKLPEEIDQLSKQHWKDEEDFIQKSDEMLHKAVSVYRGWWT